jgi:polar amino acid transport system substrate-binding protein
MFRYFILGVCVPFLTSCLPSSNCSQCQSPIQSPPPAQQKILHIAASDLNMPPYFIATEKIGLEQEIIKKSFESKGYNAIIEYTSNRKQKFSDRKFDCITSVTDDVSKPVVLPNYLDSIAFSNPIVPYQDMAIYLANRGFKIKTKDDLKGKKVEAFNNAEKLLNLSNIRKESNYREHASKASQVLMLYHESIDVLLMDVRMFGFYQNKMYHKIKSIERQRKEQAKQAEKPYIPHPLEISLIFSEHYYKIACHSQQVINDFNAGLNAIKQPNSANENNLSDYDKILNKPEYQSSAFPELANSEEDEG